MMTSSQRDFQLPPPSLVACDLGRRERANGSPLASGEPVPGCDEYVRGFVATCFPWEDYSSPTTTAASSSCQTRWRTGLERRPWVLVTRILQQEKRECWRTYYEICQKGVTSGSPTMMLGWLRRNVITSTATGWAVTMVRALELSDFNNVRKFGRYPLPLTTIYFSVRARQYLGLPSLPMKPPVNIVKFKRIIKSKYESNGNEELISRNHKMHPYLLLSTYYDHFETILKIHILNHAK